eukprot:8701135-Pyramimonas_sp.AAC.1
MCIRDRVGRPPAGGVVIREVRVDEHESLGGFRQGVRRVRVAHPRVDMTGIPAVMTRMMMSQPEIPRARAPDWRARVGLALQAGAARIPVIGREA